VTGITDAEGNFSINYNNKNKKISFAFKVTQANHSLGILYYLQNFFGCGNIYLDNKNFNGYKYIVSRYQDIISIIIPHFDKYPLIGSKQLDFLSFKKAIFMYKNGLLSNRNIIIDIKNGMNKKRSFEEKWCYLSKIPIFIKAEWLQAFIDGEGTFQCSIVDKVNRNKPYLSVNLTLEIAQNSHDVEILNAIKSYFAVGYLKPKYDISSLDAAKKSRSVNRLIITNTEAVIKFIDKYPMLTRKHLDYLDWKELVNLKAENIHKTVVGKDNMISLKKGMNIGRINIFNNSLLSSSDKLKYINWSDINLRCYHTKVKPKYSNNRKTIVKIYKYFSWSNVISFIIISFIFIIALLAYLAQCSELEEENLNNEFSIDFLDLIEEFLESYNEYKNKTNLGGNHVFMSGNNPDEDSYIVDSGGRSSGNEQTGSPPFSADDAMQPEDISDKSELDKDDVPSLGKGTSTLELEAGKEQDKKEAINEMGEFKESLIKRDMQENKELAKQHAKELGISKQEAWDKLFGKKDYESSASNPNTERFDVSREKWCSWTGSDPNPCSHTTTVSGCTHCEYNANYDMPLSCTHDLFNPDCVYCKSTEFGSSSEDELSKPVKYPKSDTSNKSDDNKD
jgi:hypothetical protein